MIFSLGGFKFEVAVIPQSLKRDVDYGITFTNRIGNYIALTASRKHKEEISISCITLPNKEAKNKALEPLYALASAQKSYPLVSGSGKMLGKFVIADISETQGSFMSNGSFLTQSFNLRLIRDFEK
jgi:phage protein U